jgi:hypothetical protein
MVRAVFLKDRVYSSQSATGHHRCLPGGHHRQMQRLTTRRRRGLIRSPYETAVSINTEAIEVMIVLILTNAALLLAGPRKVLFPSSPVVYKLAT